MRIRIANIMTKCGLREEKSQEIGRKLKLHVILTSGEIIPCIQIIILIYVNFYNSSKERKHGGNA